MSLRSPFKDDSKKEKKSKTKKEKEKAASSRTYDLRSKSSVLKTPNASNSPSTKSRSLNNLTATVTPSSPSSIKCLICQNVDRIRNFNLSEAVDLFTEKLKDFKLISKSLQDNTSCMDHAVNAIRHFILKFDTDSMDDFLKTFVQNIEIVRGRSQMTSCKNCQFLPPSLHSVIVRKLLLRPPQNKK